jgi:pimeloyl-ACP methyl ester carboxylesterase
MGYISDFLKLKQVFDPGKREIAISGSSVRILNDIFCSDAEMDEFLEKDDFSITENLSFSYPVFIPEIKMSRNVILLLHGLNERNWAKYLSWGFRLCQLTGSYIIFFPISFHINRTPSSWSDPRIMQQFVKERTRENDKISFSTFINYALSNRLTEEPMRFFNSGYQTVFDIVKLLNQIKTGTHRVIPAGNHVDIFAYSIGAFLAQILMMGNPDNLFQETKLFMFCGGSVFSSMHGTSKLIMDSMAYDRIYNYYLNDFEKKINRRNPFSDFLRSTQIGMSFRSMIDFSRFRSFRENLIGKLREQIRCVSLIKDKVIPADGILRTLNIRGKVNFPEVEIWDFPYDYSHENPFPVVKDLAGNAVDLWFDRLFERAALFFA